MFQRKNSMEQRKQGDRKSQGILGNVSRDYRSDRYPGVKMQWVLRQEREDEHVRTSGEQGTVQAAALAQVQI